MICQNQLFCCDNLELLSSDQIPDNSLDLIYCDVLYGTGKNYGEYVDIKPSEKNIKDFYISRLSLMYNKLKPTGSIYIQTDTRINHWMRIILDEIFGYENFRNEIIWYKKSFSENNSKTFLKRHDHILFYTKSSDFYFLPQSILNQNKAKRINRGYHNGGDKYIVYNKDEFEKFKKEQTEKGLFKDKPIKYFLDEEPYSQCHDVFIDIDDDINKEILTQQEDTILDIPIINPKSKEKENYPTQKPLKLMERIILSSSKENDLVADFFMGSGTFIVKAKELNRRYIGCDINQNSINLCQKRLKYLD